MLPSYSALLAFTAGSLLLLTGCGSKPAASQTAPAASTQTVIWIQNGWSEAERNLYHHLAEGSELMPYALMANLVSSKTGKPFLQNMERFGFISDPGGPHGLPIGLTSVRSRDKKHAGLEMVGFNCAACHVAELTYKGKTLIVDGAPSLIDLQAYQVEIKESLDATLGSPRKAAELAFAMVRDVPTSRRSGKRGCLELLLGSRGEVRRRGSGGLHGRQELPERILARGGRGGSGGLSAWQ